ncbi:unnamed protein product, partial [marine sediment metagenome]
ARFVEGEFCFMTGIQAGQKPLPKRLLVGRPFEMAMNRLVPLLVGAVREEDHSTRQGLFAEVEASVQSETRKAKFSILPHRTLVAVTVPALMRAAESFDRLDATANSARLAIALRQYKRDHGEYPGQLEPLVPGYVDALPQDPFDGQTFRYRRDGDGFLLYSIGRDRTDDGGAPTQNRSGDLPWRAAR